MSRDLTLPEGAEELFRCKYALVYRRKYGQKWSEFNGQLFVSDLFPEIKKLFPAAEIIPTDSTWDSPNIRIAPNCVLVVGRFDHNTKSVNYWVHNPNTHRLKNNYGLPKLPDVRIGIERPLATIAKALKTRVIDPSEEGRKVCDDRLAAEKNYEAQLDAWAAEIKAFFPTATLTKYDNNTRLRGTLKLNDISRDFTVYNGHLTFENIGTLTFSQTNELFTVLARWRKQNS